MANKKNKLTPEGAIVNFLFFMYNHSGMFKIIEEAFAHKGENLVNHYKQKLEEIIGDDQVCRPDHIVRFLMELNTDLKIKFAEYVNENYDSGFSGMREGE